MHAILYWSREGRDIPLIGWKAEQQGGQTRPAYCTIAPGLHSCYYLGIDTWVTVSLSLLSDGVKAGVTLR
jgi:hypothetical protein